VAAAEIYVLPNIAAFAAGVQTPTLRKWVQRGHISAPVNGLYDLVEIERFCRERDADRERYGQALSGRRRRGESRRVPCAKDRHLSR
jgi:hypothetical protein